MAFLSKVVLLNFKSANHVHLFQGLKTLDSDEPETSLIDGVPVLVVEILSPSDTQEQIDEKIDDYLRAGVAVVWIIDPHDKTVLIYRKDAEPELLNITQELSGEPHLPGFRVPVGEIFR